MKLMAVIKNTLILLAVLLLNSLTFVGHTAAMSTMQHEMSGWGHGSSDTTSCATLCRTAVITKEENGVRNDSDEEDDKSVASFYVDNQRVWLDSKTISQRLYAAEIKPPPKIPIYILYGVFRA